MSARTRVAEALRQVEDRTGLRSLRHDSEDVASLSEAVAENARLAVLLERQVAAIEASLVPLLERDDDE